jgi:hypothetical protein
MTIRALIFGICLIGTMASSGHAQVAVPGPDSPPTDRTPNGGAAIDGTQKTPDTTAPVPEVVDNPRKDGDVIHPKTTEDPGAVLRPPNVDPRMHVERPDEKNAVPR